MIKGKETYPLKEYKTQRSYRYLFTSEGKKDIIKVVEYRYMGSVPAGDIFNLGFGNYIPETNDIVADVISNNGDAYKVFNTVLSTIPAFFEMVPDALLMIQGSDSDPSFAETCRKTCIRKCKRQCRNEHRRINIYRKYLDANLELFSKDYLFLGRIGPLLNEVIGEIYLPGKEYLSIFIIKKQL